MSSANAALEARGFQEANASARKHERERERDRDDESRAANEVTEGDTRYEAVCDEDSLSPRASGDAAAAAAASAAAVAATVMSGRRAKRDAEMRFPLNKCLTCISRPSSLSLSRTVIHVFL